MSISQQYKSWGLPLSERLANLQLYPQQEEAIEWALRQPEPYLFINAPTGSGKTLINTTIGMRSSAAWTYAVHTIMLQKQVAETFEDLPVFVGRANFPCLIGEETHLKPITAADAICTEDDYVPGDCEHEHTICPYYSQARRALASRQRVANYALLLSYPPLVLPTRRGVTTQLLLADEAHNVEEAVCSSVAVQINRRTLRRAGVAMPALSSLADWRAWCQRMLDTGLSSITSKDPGYKVMLRAVNTIAAVPDTDLGHWLVEQDEFGVSFKPIWGAPFVMEKLLGHREPPVGASLAEYTPSPGISKAVFTSATLMGAEYIADMLGFPEGSWAYLDLPSSFPASNRPINYAPVDSMNAGKMSTPDGRAKMQAAIDHLIEFYVRTGRPWGVIHAVSNKYRDNLLTESRWRGIMTSDPAIHEAKVMAAEASVLVAANLIEGWDGRDDLCRFVLMPKVPYPNLGDKRTALRKDEDQRSYDHRALVAIVQGAGRGVRHKEDNGDTWILDAAWRQLIARRGSWLPQSFKDAYNHNCALPTI